MNNLLESIPLIILLGIATYTDLRYRIIPDWLSGVGIGYSLAFRLLHSVQPFYYYLLGILIGAGLLYVFAIIKPDSFGGGDIKLMAVVGMVLGWQKSMLFLISMLTVAWLFAIAFKWAGYGVEEFPLAPFYLMAYLMLFTIGGI
ncbi:prepilin peptidase [Paenibacillus senegalimassiliensis]|uniref:prepilin peptidase n=1 Tax=Paenibacillus senegalimassiliensis TaxID=1737426 RepID=UPI00073EC33A|nr:A24 family peptidase [Paenibacillus senegalimassiliensis]